jgi:hypothetical protein
MKKYLMFLLAVVMVFCLTMSATAETETNEGLIPIKEWFSIASNGAGEEIPSTLAEGQVWVQKSVEAVDEEYGKFEITLYAWSTKCSYKLADGTQLTDQWPLDGDEDATVDIIDYIGSQFYLVSYDNCLSDENGIVTWQVAQSQICGDDPATASFIVALKEGWKADEEYFTNENAADPTSRGAYAAFTPVKGNPYYWVKDEVNKEATFSVPATDKISWNNKGEFINGYDLHITRKVADVTTVQINYTHNSNWYNGETRTAINSIDNTSWTIISNIRQATPADKGEIGNPSCTWVLTFALQQVGTTTVYNLNLYFLSAGGNEPVEGNLLGSRETITRVDYEYKDNVGWVDDHVETDLNNTGSIKISFIPYTVTWLDEDGTELDSETYIYGELPSYKDDPPTKEADDEFTYTFIGWEPEIVEVTKDATYKAVYDSTRNYYTVTWLDEDGVTVLDSERYTFGETPTFKLGTPTKDATDEFSYTFAGWDPEVVAVTEDAEYVATFTPVTRSYTVIWENYDGTELDKETYLYGAMPSYKKVEPTKASTPEFSYTFAGWAPTIAAVNGDATYVAQFTPVTRSYTVIWENYDGTELDAETYLYGATPSYKKTDPTRAATAQYTYTFKGWTPAIVDVVGNATYTAEYTSAVNKYTVSFIDADGNPWATPVTDVCYGKPVQDVVAPDLPLDTAKWTYTGWNTVFESGNAQVKGDEVLRALATHNTYTVTYVFGGVGGDINPSDFDIPGKYFKTGDGRNEGEIVYAAIPYGNKFPRAPYPWAEFGYKFLGWSLDGGKTIAFKALEATKPSILTPALPLIVEGDVTLTAKWSLVNEGQKFPDKIPSVTHVDRWWTDYGILCFGASTGDLPYFVGFSNWFFDVYYKVGIGFGTNGSWPYVATFYKDVVVWEKHVDGSKVGTLLVGAKEADLDKMKGYQVSKNIGTVNGVKVDVYGIHNKVIFDAQYSNGGKKNTNFGNLKGIWFDDPWGTGSRQAWLGAPIDLFGTGDSPKPVYTVSFDSAGGTPVPPQLIEKDDVERFVADPGVIVKAGYEFDSWRLDGDLYDFNTPVTSNLVLVAKWIGEPIEEPTVLTATAVARKEKGTDYVTITVFSDGEVVPGGIVEFTNLGKNTTLPYTVGGYQVDVKYDNGGKIVSAVVVLE